MSITPYTNNILNANYGDDVRDSIVNALNECYKDATGNPDSVAALVQQYVDREESINSVVSSLTGLYEDIGTIVRSVRTGAVDNTWTNYTLPTSTWTIVDQINLTKGTWLLISGSSIPPGERGYFQLIVANTTESSFSNQTSRYEGLQPFNSYPDRYITAKSIVIENDSTYYLWAYQTAESTKTIAPYMLGIKIKGDTVSEESSPYDQIVANTQAIETLQTNQTTTSNALSSLQIQHLNDMREIEEDLAGNVTILSSRIDDLENSESGGGLTDNERALILNLFSKAAYAEDDAGDAYDQLSALWSVYSVTWSGTGYTHGNTSVSARGGSTYVSTVTASGGYTINTVVATMGGVTVQGAWNNGTVTIPNVTGDIVITVTTIQAEVSSISAIYTQSGTVYDTDSLDRLKSDLVVTATYVDQSTSVVPAAEYSLSGTLTEGTSTVTVTYGGKTTTFDVVVSHQTQVVKTYFSDVPTLTTGYLKKTNGSDQALSGGSYVELDYVDGMYIHSRMNSSWSAYLNIVLYNGSTYSSVPMTKTGSEAYPTYENTLSGYTGITKVYVNCVNANINDCYYEVEV